MEEEKKNEKKDEKVMESKKMVKKSVKCVSFERVISRKGVFSVKVNGDGVLWAVREGGNYLYFVVDERKKEMALRYLKMLIKEEELEKEAKREAKEEAKRKKEDLNSK